MLKSAVVGTGYLGRFHAQKHAKSPNTELVAVVDISAERAAKVGEEVGAVALTDYRKLPELGVQCVSIATDTTTHCEVASYLLAHGIDVLVEKPMTATVDEARALIRLAREHGRILQAGHLERFNPAFRPVREIIQSPRFFEARRIAPFSGRAFDVDVVRDLMIHDIDIIAHLAGRSVKHIEAIGVPVITPSIDIANARITFEGGSCANVTASRAAFASERTIRVFGQNVYVSIDFGNKKVKVCRVSEERDARGFPQLDMQAVAVEERDALQDEIESFFQTVISRGTPEVTGEDGLCAIEVAERIEAAIAANLADALPHN